MGSRIGSIAILIVIAVIVAAVVVVISRLDLLNTGEPDAAVMVVSLQEGDLLLLNQPQSITVTISSGSPIATLELIVDDAQVAEVIPPYSQDRGAWIGSFVWTPDRLGFADVRIVALDANGVESLRQVRVEVTDDQARVAAALRVTVLGISPLQQFPAGAGIRLELSATGNQPIERFDMHIDGEHIVSVTPDLDNTGRYSAAIEWTPNQTGEVEVTITAVDVLGRQESQTIPVILVRAGAPVTPRDAEDQSEPGEEADDPPDPVEQLSEDGQARIESPSDGERFTLDSDFEFDVELSARNVGDVASALLYITPIAPDNTLGNSVLIHSSEGLAPGNYSERIADVERWITSSGSYELQLVVFTPENDRYDHRIIIHVVAVADGGQGVEQEDSDQDPSTRDEIDLAIVTARQDEDNHRRLNVTITNASAVDVDRTDVVITVKDADTEAELASAAVTLGIESGDLRTIPLDLDLDTGRSVDAIVELEAGVDTSADNNTFRVTIAPPDVDGDETEQQEQDEQAVQEDQTASELESEAELSGPSPDLTFLDAQSTNDGYVLLTVINNGDAPAETFRIVISNSAGEELEVVTRRAADTQPLNPGDTEILTSLQPHSGLITITVIAGGDVLERELDNNAMTLEIRG